MVSEGVVLLMVNLRGKMGKKDLWLRSVRVLLSGGLVASWPAGPLIHLSACPPVCLCSSPPVRLPVADF